MKEKHSYFKEIIDSVCDQNISEPEVRAGILKRLSHGYAVISEELSKEFAKKEYFEKGIRS